MDVVAAALPSAGRALLGGRQGRSRRSEFVAGLSGRLLRGSVGKPIAWMRARQDCLPILSRDMDRVQFEAAEFAGVSCWVATPKAMERPPRTIVYYHGGGYVIGSARGYRATVSTLARLSEARVIAVEYRLGPEHPFPAAHEDCLAVARAVLEGVRHPVGLAGDSAGGALCVDVLDRLHTEGEGAVDACALISPWVDPTREWSEAEMFDRDILSPELVAQWIDAYAGDAGRDHPRLRVDDRDLRFMPRCYVQVAGAELFYAQIADFYRRCREQGVAIEWREFPAQFHVFQTLGFYVPEARPALAEMAGWLRRAL